MSKRLWIAAIAIATLLATLAPPTETEAQGAPSLASSPTVFYNTEGVPPVTENPQVLSSKFPTLGVFGF